MQPVAALRTIEPARKYCARQHLRLRGRLLVAQRRSQDLRRRGDYVNVHTRDAQHLVHLSLNRLEARLDGQRFSRIHRTYIVSLDHVAAFQRQSDGRLVARLSDGASLPVSRSKAHEFRAISR